MNKKKVIFDKERAEEWDEEAESSSNDDKDDSSMNLSSESEDDPTSDTPVFLVEEIESETESEEETIEKQIGMFEKTLMAAKEHVRAYQTQRDACKK